MLVAYVVEALVEKRLVVVAEVPVPFRKVKFWRVVEELARNCWKEETRVVEVARKYGAYTRPVNPPPPVTERVEPGEVVPMPTFPAKYAKPVVVALVVVELPKIASWEKRLVELAVVEKRFVVVALVKTLYRENRLVEVALVELAFVVKRLVEVAFVVVLYVTVRLV